METSLTGQVALLTGAGTGIGAAIARSLSNLGSTIVLCGRRKEKLDEVGSTLAGPYRSLVCDVKEEGDVKSVVDQTVAEFGAMHLLVNNAGVFYPTPFDDLNVADWDDVLDSNLRGAFLATKYSWPHLKASRGQIVNISSISGTKGFSGGAAYCASKFAMNGLSEVLRIEGKPYGIRVHTICPGPVNTPIWEPLANPEELGRMMTADTIADLVRFSVTSPRGIDLSPIVVTNFVEPWSKPG